MVFRKQTPIIGIEREMSKEERGEMDSKSKV
jgi:hypothetical protein